MDNLTHSLVGALIGQTGLKRRTGLAMPALVIGANLPDVDGVCMLLGTQGLALRRGVTHGPIAWVLLPLALAAILWAYDRWQAERGRRPEGRAPVRFGQLYLLGLLACLTHPALDWLNSYGIRFLSPFSGRWFYGDVLFIIDLWLWFGLGFATWLSLRRERDGNGQQPAKIALAAALAYVGTNAAITWAAEDRARMREPYPRVAIANEVPVEFWRRELITGDGDGIWRVGGQVLGDVSLSRCDLAAARADDPDAHAFLVWSRAPYVERLSDGRWRLGDARFAGRGARFAVVLPARTCAES
jgi:inner membrane protein